MMELFRFSLKKFLSSDGILVYLLMALRCGISRLGTTNLLNFCYIQNFSKPFLFTSHRNILNPKLEQFILELGKDFIFMDQEYRLNIGTSTFKADLLFFHRGLQALVAVELKKTKFHPRDLGQLEFYLEALDRDVKRSNENPSIGIILCPEADQVVVEYAMSRSMSPTMIAEYKRILIPQERMQQQLNEFCNLFLNKD